MTKSFRNIIGAVTILGLLASPVFAAQTKEELLKSLQEKMIQLRAQIEALQQAQTAVQNTETEIQGTLGLIRGLREGMTGNDVKKLQEFLSGDREIYPEGLITGFYGRLTAKAVKKFQARHGIDQLGIVGPKTLEKLNERIEERLIKQGYGIGLPSGEPCEKVPPGHLIAPGYLKKHGNIRPLIPPCQLLPPGIAKKIHDDDDEDDDDDNGTTTPDIIAPIISNVNVTGIAQTSVTINWTTNEVSDSRVEYGTTTSYGSSTTLNTSLVTAHSQALTGLAASTLYHYRVISRDGAHNTATSSDATFTSSSIPDTTSPILSLVTNSGTTATSTNITWTTDETATSKVWYTTALPLLIAPATLHTGSVDLVTSHVTSLGSLTASTTYFYLAVSGDASGNSATSSVFSFTTL